MIDAKKLTFNNWTEYDDWLVQNYADNAIYSVNEVNGKIEIEYCSKAEFMEETKRKTEEKERLEKERLEKEKAEKTNTENNSNTQNKA